MNVKLTRKDEKLNEKGGNRDVSVLIAMRVKVFPIKNLGTSK